MLPLQQAPLILEDIYSTLPSERQDEMLVISSHTKALEFLRYVWLRE